MKQKQFNNCQAFRFKRFAGKAYSAFNSMHKVVNIGVLTGCTLMFIGSATLSAQSADKQQKQPEALDEELDEVMVTASRIEMPISQSAKLVTIISKEQISQAPVQSFHDLLNYVANIDAIQRGGHGVQTDISIRGGSADQTAILINGINISNAQTGHYSLDIPLNLSDIQRIEILHGPSALIYGSSAFSGGINIITNTTNDIPIYAKAESGMYKLRGLEIRGAKQNGKVINTLSVGYNSSEGYIPNTDYEIYNALLQTRIHLKNESKVDIQLGYNDKKYGANGFYSAKFPNQYEQTSSYIGTAKGEFGEKLKFIPILYWNRHHDHFQLERGSDFGENYHRSDTYGTNLIMTYRSPIGNTSLGSELRREDIISSVLGKTMNTPHGNYKKEDGRTNASMALEHTYGTHQFVFSAGALLNHNTSEEGEYQLYPSLSISYRPTEKLNIYASWNKSSRMPTFTDLYYTTETHEANVELRSEKSESIDLGIKFNAKLINAYATVYMMQGKDIIDWVQNDEGKWASWNHTKLDKKGLELGAKLRLHTLTSFFGKQAYLSADYARLHQTADTRKMISRFSTNYLRDKLTIQFNHAIYDKLTVGWYFRYQKRMGQYEWIEDKTSKGMMDFPAFSTLDLRLNYTYRNIGLYLNMNNVYDANYFDLGNIPQSGAWLIGGVTYKI